jgi:tRNA(Ile)-lysidine synthase
VSLPTQSELTALLPPRRKHLVGVSGGADSVALLHLLMNAGLKQLVVCHVDHQLRGRESTADAKFVATICRDLGLTHRGARVPVRRIAAERGQSLETAAREVRYECFAAWARELRCPRIILAHHADDQAETILWNLLRGSHGAKGMQARQSRHVGQQEIEIFRPLLTTRRQELRDFLLEKNLPWREDSSNAQPIATRNRMRHEVLPLLSDIARRDVTPLLLRQGEAQQDCNELEAWALARIHARDPQGRLHLTVLKELPPALQRLVFRDYLLRHEVGGISRDLLDRCCEMLDHEPSHCVNLPGGGFLRRRQGRITCHPAS